MEIIWIVSGQSIHLMTLFIAPLGSNWLPCELKEHYSSKLVLTTVPGKLLLYAVSGSFTLAKTCSFQAFSYTESEKVQKWERSVIPILSGLNKSATLSLYLHPSPTSERSGALVLKEGRQVRATLLTPTHLFPAVTIT